jgi:hypothetical protein
VSPDLIAMRLSARVALVAAAAGVAGFSFFGNPRVGIALAIGMLVGVVANRGLTTLLTTTQGFGKAGFGLASVLKLGALTIAALTVGGVMGRDLVWVTLLGMAATQIMLALSASYALVRAK